MNSLLDKEAKEKIEKPDFSTRAGRLFLAKYLEEKFYNILEHDSHSETPVFKWVVKALGLIFQGLYTAFAVVGIENIGLCIIIFTLVVKLLMLPLTVKQQKFTKLSAVMNPEIQAIQAKYKGKRDQQSQMAMQEETKAVYEKYGTSPSGSCLQLIIQMPILFALYRVIMNVAAYVPQVKAYYTSIIDTLSVDYIKNTFDISVSSVDNLSGTQINKIVDILSGASRSGAAFSTSDWSNLISQSLDKSTAQHFYDKINSINSIGFGINLSQSPSALFHAGIVIALAIPILAGLTQWFSAFLTNRMTQAASKANSKDGSATSQTMNQSMKMMTIMMPLMSVWFCYQFASGIGVYWVCSALFQAIQTIIINKYLEKKDVQELIEENLKKKKKKRNKPSLTEKLTGAAKATPTTNRSLADKAKVSSSAKNVQVSDAPSAMSNSAETANGSVKKSSGGGIASKANMVKDFNSKNSK